MPEPSSRARVLLMPALLISAVAVLGAVYSADRDRYLQVLHLWGFRPFSTPFLDTATLISQIRCSHQHVDVYVSNACIILGVPFDYSPLWLRMGFLARAQAWSSWIGLLWVACFAIALLVLPPARSARQAAVIGLGVFSPVTVFALERGNADVLIFILAAAAIAFLEGRFLLRVLGYCTIIGAALLKFYPLVLLLPMLRERPRRLVLCLLATATVLGVFVVVYGSELLRALSQIPHPLPFEDGFGAMQLPSGLALMAQLAGVKPAIAAVLVASCLAVSVGMARHPGFGRACGLLSIRHWNCLLTGALLITVCFFGGANIGYRGVLLVFALPGLLELAGSPSVSRIVRLGPVVAVLAMWNLVPVALLGPHGPWPSITGVVPFFLVWFCRELVWWWTVAILLAAIFCEMAQVYALQSPRERFSGMAGLAGTPQSRLESHQRRAPTDISAAIAAKSDQFA